MSQNLEGYLKVYKKNEIFYQIWKSSQKKTLGTLFITHGLAEHSDSYRKFSNTLNQWGWNTIAWDLLGHGRSSGQRGYVEDFDDFIKIQKFLIQWMQTRILSKGEKLILFSHSMGALISLKSFIKYKNLKIHAICLSSPCLGLSFTPPWMKVQLARFAAKFFPRITLYNEIKYKDLSRNKKMIEEYKKDALRHDRISPRLFLGLMESISFVKKRAKTLTPPPLLLQTGGKDNVTNPKEALHFYNNLSSSHKKHCHYKKSYHEIYNDLDQKEAFKDLKAFLKNL